MLIDRVARNDRAALLTVHSSIVLQRPWDPVTMDKSRALMALSDIPSAYTLNVQ